MARAPAEPGTPGRRGCRESPRPFDLQGSLLSPLPGQRSLRVTKQARERARVRASELGIERARSLDFSGGLGGLPRPDEGLCLGGAGGATRAPSHTRPLGSLLVLFGIVALYLEVDGPTPSLPRPLDQPKHSESARAGVTGTVTANHLTASSRFL